MTTTSYLSAGIVAAILSLTAAPALAGDNPGGCRHLKDGVMWNTCDHGAAAPKGRPNPRAERQTPAASLPITRDRGIWGRILPDSIDIRRNTGFPGDRRGGSDGGNGGDGGGDGGARG